MPPRRVLPPRDLILDEDSSSNSISSPRRGGHLWWIPEYDYLIGTSCSQPSQPKGPSSLFSYSSLKGKWLHQDETSRVSWFKGWEIASRIHWWSIYSPSYSGGDIEGENKMNTLLTQRPCTNMVHPKKYEGRWWSHPLGGILSQLPWPLLLYWPNRSQNYGIYVSQARLHERVGVFP